MSGYDEDVAAARGALAKIGGALAGVFGVKDDELPWSSERRQRQVRERVQERERRRLARPATQGDLEKLADDVMAMFASEELDREAERAGLSRKPGESVADMRDRLVAELMPRPRWRDGGATREGSFKTKDVDDKWLSGVAAWARNAGLSVSDAAGRPAELFRTPQSSHVHVRAGAALDLGGHTMHGPHLGVDPRPTPTRGGWSVWVDGAKVTVTKAAPSKVKVSVFHPKRHIDVELEDRTPPPPPPPPPSLSPDAIKLLTFLRDSAGQWFTRPELRVAMGYSPEGFGEPVFAQAISELERHGIKVVEDLGVIDSADRRIMHWRTGVEPDAENVYRLP